MRCVEGIYFPTAFLIAFEFPILIPFPLPFPSVLRPFLTLFPIPIPISYQSPIYIILITAHILQNAGFDFGCVKQSVSI
jgi:hypothetical protein